MDISIKITPIDFHQVKIFCLPSFAKGSYCILGDNRIHDENNENEIASEKSINEEHDTALHVEERNEDTVFSK